MNSVIYYLIIVILFENANNANNYIFEISHDFILN